MLPTGPSVLASVGLVSVWNGDTCQRNSRVAGRIVVGVLAGHSLPQNQNETKVLALEACIRCTILAMEYGSMVWSCHCRGQSYCTEYKHPNMKNQEMFSALPSLPAPMNAACLVKQKRKEW